ncbi:MAG: hypothetical protein LQ348_003403 [Seirophora lacunosa]|nr:MAG: hypothetical protein LQ348_003403 [Seirophora lacunosa]
MALRQDPEKLHFEGFVPGTDTKASSDYDKNYPEHSEHHDNATGPASYDPIIDRFTDAEIKRVVRKIDMRLIPLCGLMYCVSLLDRTNLSNAAIAGMTAELNLRTRNPDRYSVITLVFFITYVIAQPPTTILTRFFGPRIWLATITLAWGVTMIGFGFVQDWTALVGLRLLLGILELTCLVAFLGYIFLISFPDNVKSRSIRFISEEERQLIIARVNQDRGDADLEKFTFKRWLGGGADWKIWAYGLCFGCATTVSYALAYFLPIILNEELGFDTGTAQCLIAPPYAFAAIVMIGTGWFGDKYHQRGACVAFNAMLCIIGLAVMGWAYGDTRARYFGVFFATAGANANVPSVLTYQANNIRGQWKRAFCSATLVGMGALGGIVGSTVFRSQDSPTYIPGLSVAMGSQVVILLTVAALTMTFKTNNKKADRGEKILEDSPSFRYGAVDIYIQDFMSPSTIHNARRIYKIASIPADGIGPEVVSAAIQVLNKLATVHGGFEFHFDHFDWSSDLYKKTGRYIPDGGLDSLKKYDAILFGAVGDREVPDHISLWGLRLAICQPFQQYANLRPTRVLRGTSSPLRNCAPGSLDWLIVRENTEGEYAGQGGRTHIGTPWEVATEVAIFSRHGVERLMRFAFECARKRPRKKVTVVTKSNAQRNGLVLWDEVATAVAQDFPDVEWDKMLVDAMTVRMTLQPETIDTIVATNLHADILSDLAAALAGSIGIAPTSNLDPSREYPSMFEPIHGTAWDIAGKGIANPVATFWTAAEMVRWLGYEAAADDLMECLERVCEQGIKTADLGGSAQTSEVTEAVCEEIERVVRPEGRGIMQ